MIASDKGRVIAAGWSGKVKTASTMVCVVLMFLPIPPVVNTICVVGNHFDHALFRRGVFCEEPAGYFEREYVKAVLRRDGSAAAPPFVPRRGHERERRLAV
mgnify:CR=1 FL=1